MIKTRAMAYNLRGTMCVPVFFCEAIIITDPYEFELYIAMRDSNSGATANNHYNDRAGYDAIVTLTTRIIATLRRRVDDKNAHRNL